MASTSTVLSRVLTMLVLIGMSSIVSWFFVISPVLDAVSLAAKTAGKLLAGA